MRYIGSKITSSYISENYPKTIDRSGKINLIFRICKLATL